MDWSKGYSASFSLHPVDPSTWASGPEACKIASASVEMDATDEYPLLQAGSVDATLGTAESFQEGYYRIEMQAEQGGERVRVAVATLLMSSGDSTMDRGSQTARLTGSSVLRPAADRLMLTGTYAPKGCDGASYAASLLRECVHAPVEALGSFTLDEHAVFGPGVSYLQAAWTVLKAADWCMQIAGDGTVTVRPKPTEAALVLDAEGRELVMPGADMAFDLADVPNCYFAVAGDDVGVAVNEQEGSRTSYAARGRWVDYIDDSPVKVDGETMTAYARRKLEEMSTVTREYGLTREYIPGFNLFDLAAGTVPEFGMDGAFRSLRQSLECGRGITVRDTLGQEIKEFTA